MVFGLKMKRHGLVIGVVGGRMVFLHRVFITAVWFPPSPKGFEYRALGDLREDRLTFCSLMIVRHLEHPRAV